jgi:hypothetical protein
MNESFDWRRSDRQLFSWAAVLFAAIILIGFGRTYYLKFAFDSPAVPSALVHVHGLLMTVWVLFFAAQVWLIRSKQARTHMKLGLAGIGLAVLIVITGFFTSAAAAKYGSTSSPPDIPALNFMIVPMTDLLMFAVLFGAAVYYRKRPADHKRLMLLTAVNFLPPALARIPVDAIAAAGPLFFFGAPTVILIGLLAYDTRRTGKLNKIFLAGSVLIIASYPLRLVISGSAPWLSFAQWVTGWAA